MKPLAIDLYCGLGGWAEGFLAEGYEVIGFDIERHDYGTGGYPGQLVLQDVLTLHGSQLRDAAVIVASPPCQAYSYRAMPWKRAKALPPPDNALFEACFRIQREANEAVCHCACWRCTSGGHCVRCDCFGGTGKYPRYIPLIVENVKGAQPWVGRAKWHFGSYYLWGDIPALMPIARSRAQKVNPDGTGHPPGSWFAIADSKNRGSKSTGQDWGRFAKTGEVSPHWRMEGLKLQDHINIRDGHSHTRHLTNPAEHTKNQGGSWFKVAHNTASGVGQNPDGRKQSGSGSGSVWFDTGIAKESSRSSKRKAASAQIAKVPFPLARHIAQCFRGLF